MKPILLFSTLFLTVCLSLNTYAFEKTCQSNNAVVNLEIEKISTTANANETYNQKIPMALGSLKVTIGDQSYTYSENIYLIAEGQGNYFLYIYGLKNGMIETVAQLYYELESNALHGFIKKPVFETYDDDYKLLIGYDYFIGQNSVLRCE
ncbi:MAG: hypothetical protein HON90_13605 [Halobacteriovoraceae bacterium]|jgi:hypothetical protein|nr:hypothetical protein [Halobacteriovoraceae bacterium]